MARPSLRSGVGFLVLLAAALVSPPPPVAAQEGGIVVAEARWGFDGTIREFAFVPVSFLVRNNSAALQKVRLRLGRCDTPPTFHGDVYEQEVTLGPNSARWVQFVPVTENTVVQWHLQFGPHPADFYPLPLPRAGQGAVVLLDSPNRRFTPASLERLPVELFPASVTATDLLETLFLDHSPEFDGVRLQTFRDWLNRGGKLVLLQNDDGRFPEFPELVELNDPAGLFRVGHGRVQRVTRRAREISAEEVHELTRVPTVRMVRIPKANQSVPVPVATIVPKSGFLMENVVEALCRFRRPWWLIYPIALVYLAIIGPLGFLLARSGNLRGFAILFASAAIGTSALFIVVNRVSVGTQSRLTSIAIARQVTDRVWDIRRWASFANVAGGTYGIEGKGSGPLYASIQGDGSTLIEGGRYELRRPTMSTFTFQQKERQEFDAPWITLRANASAAAAVTQTAVGEVLVDLHGPLERLPAKSAAGYLVSGNSIQPLKLKGSSLVLDTGSTTIDDWYGYRWMADRPAYQRVDDFLPPSEEEVFLSLLDPLVRYVLVDPRTGLPATSTDTVRVFILAPAPDAMQFQEGSPHESGYVLFVLEP